MARLIICGIGTLVLLGAIGVESHNFLILAKNQPQRSDELRKLHFENPSLMETEIDGQNNILKANQPTKSALDSFHKTLEKPHTPLSDIVAELNEKMKECARVYKIQEDWRHKTQPMPARKPIHVPGLVEKIKELRNALAFEKISTPIKEEKQAIQDIWNLMCHNIAMMRIAGETSLTDDMPLFI